ncbi:MAG: hypothetical protein MUF14_10195 [Hyphomonadaceae bacterium]|nr:hypothetical protein [Hyphomonadaceae bacterium]
MIASRHWRNGAIIAGALMLGGAATPDQRVDYAVRYTATTAPSLQVTISLKGDADGTTQIELPNSWGGEERLYELISNFAVQGGSAETPPERPSTRIIRHRPGQRLRITYQVASGWQADPVIGMPRASNPYRPIIRPDWFNVLGNGVFALPAGGTDRPARIRWQVPSGWTLASDTQHADLDLKDIVESVTLAGPDVRLYSETVEGGPLRIAVRGQLAMDEAALVRAVTTVSAAQRRFWRSRGESFLVTLVPIGTAPGAISVGGTGRGDAFAVWTVADAPLETLERLLAHEHIHTWIPRRIGAMQVGPKEPEQYWLSEGFTEFYTFRSLLASGIWSADEFVAAWNQQLLEYASSPVRTVSNQDAAMGFWSDPDLQRLPYTRGAVIAAMLDHDIRTATDGRQDLDDLMLAMQAQHQADPTELVSTRALRLARELYGVDFGPRLEAIHSGGTDAIFPAGGWGPCLTVRTAEQAEFHRGFDVAATQRNGLVVTGTIEGSPAWQAGLRDGMRIIRRTGGSPPDPTVPLTYLIDDSGTERTLSWLPEGPRRFTVQALELGPQGTTPACLARLAGQ